MPRLDGSGPFGQGAGSGRGLGPCGCAFRASARGFGRGQRFISPKNELSALEEEEKILEQELALLREEKSALEKSQK